MRLGGERPNVLLEGEAGSGKSLAASLLHRWGRPETPIVVVDGAATPEGLVADVLFGAPAERGRPWLRPGVLELAAGGAVILEEVCHLPAAAKAMLLKALGQPPMRRQHDGPTHTWIISTCNIDMDEAMRHGYFGRALFRRLAGVRIVMPPLRECGNDALIIAYRLLPRLCAQHQRALMTLAPEVEKRLLAYYWPGNGRELTHMLTRAVLCATGSVISVGDLDMPPERQSSISKEEFDGKMRDLGGPS